jgi:thiazole synthase ThiGH ThiG subunit
MELGCDVSWMNTATPRRKIRIRAARAMRLAVEVGRHAYLSGRMGTRNMPFQQSAGRIDSSCAALVAAGLFARG